MCRISQEAAVRIHRAFAQVAALFGPRVVSTDGGALFAFGRV